MVDLSADKLAELKAKAKYGMARFPDALIFSCAEMWQVIAEIEKLRAEISLMKPEYDPWAHRTSSRGT